MHPRSKQTTSSPSGGIEPVLSLENVLNVLAYLKNDVNCWTRVLDSYSMKRLCVLVLDVDLNQPNNGDLRVALINKAKMKLEEIKKKCIRSPSEAIFLQKQIRPYFFCLFLTYDFVTAEEPEYNSYAAYVASFFADEGRERKAKKAGSQLIKAFICSPHPLNTLDKFLENTNKQAQAAIQDGTLKILTDLMQTEGHACEIMERKVLISSQSPQAK